jgi:purine-binding chemotaxis protein CheW
MSQPALAQTKKASDMQVVVFEIGEETFAVRIENVREIIPMESITQIPRAPSFIRGVIDLRGMVIPVIDLRERFSLPRGEETENRIVVVEMSGQVVGCMVDDVSEVLTLSGETIQPAPPTTQSIDSEYLLGVARHGDRLFILLDLDKVFSESEREALMGVTEDAAEE